MGSGRRIAHQSHTVTPTETTAPAADPRLVNNGDQLLFYPEDSSAIHHVALDPDTGALQAFYNRPDAGDGHSIGYPVGTVTADQWEAMIAPGASVGRAVQNLRRDAGANPQQTEEAATFAAALLALRDNGAFPGPATPTPVVRAGADDARVGDAAEHDAARAATEAAAAARPQPEVSFQDNPEAFQAAYAAAQERAAAGQPVVPYLTDNVTGGLGARDGGRGFGVELEFDFPSGTNHQIALTNIAREMHEQGLAQDPHMHGYHAGRGAQQDQYTSDANGWRLERDSTVAGEIVSPILYDEPQTWDNLNRVCDIIRRNGGVASVRTGGHVTVSAHDYDHTPDNHSRLVTAFSQYEDTLYRLASHPDRGSHRGLSWCRPNRQHAPGYSTISEANLRNNGHHVGLNLQHIRGRDSDRVEFRLWDGTLDPGVIQAQINLSLGMTDAAVRGSVGSPTSAPQVLGTGRRSRAGELRGRAWRERTASIRELADSLFHRRANHEQVASLFAATRWQPARGRA